jgi:hypothetical protein
MRTASWRKSPPVILEADGRWYVGHGNGLFELFPLVRMWWSVVV